jgi:serine phosphatase RsbU (regulator of sigma subunit)
MKFLQSQSGAFRTAVLKSERLRIYILLSIVTLVFLIRALRTWLAWNDENAKALLWIGVAAVLFAVMEGFVLRAIRQALKAGAKRPHWFWLSNVLWEMVFPGVLIAYMKSDSIPQEYRAVTSPVFLLYFLLITLSTLRLNPAVSLLCGVTASISYTLAAIHHGWSFRWLTTQVSLYAPQKEVTAYAAGVVVAGLAAALVAREIRNQVEAALREAETRREVENLQRDLDVARSIQQSLLPKSMPQVAGFDIAAWNKPADKTGGDYYDWQQLPDGRVVMALADVTGHGIGPALLAAVCRAYSRATFGQHNGMVETMSRINASLAQDVSGGRFVMFVATIVGPEDSKVELLSAGQAPIFVYWLKKNCFDKMEAQGPPLGITAEFVSDPQKVLAFEDGDLLVLTTDGFFEWENATKEMFGSERLENSVRGNREKPAEEIIGCLYLDVLGFAAGTAQKDDLTAIVIKRVVGR